MLFFRFFNFIGDWSFGESKADSIVSSVMVLFVSALNLLAKSLIKICGFLKLFYVTVIFNSLSDTWCRSELNEVFITPGPRLAIEGTFTTMGFFLLVILILLF